MVAVATKLEELRQHEVNGVPLWLLEGPADTVECGCVGGQRSGRRIVVIE